MITSRPLSNGTMGALWRERWCARCEPDHGYHNDGDDNSKACMVLLRLLTDGVSEAEPMDELTDRNESGGWDPARLECSKFSECRPCFDPKYVAPRPELIGQLDIYGYEVGATSTTHGG